MRMVAVCRTCDRQFPLPLSGRTQCLACMVHERREQPRLSSTRPPTVRERRGPSSGRRAVSDRRIPGAERRDRSTDRRRRPDRHIPFADRRFVASRRRNLERRSGEDRRSTLDRRLAVPA